MNIEILIWLLFFTLLFIICISSLLIRVEIIELEEKIENLQNKIKKNK